MVASSDRWCDREDRGIDQGRLGEVAWRRTGRWCFSPPLRAAACVDEGVAPPRHAGVLRMRDCQRTSGRLLSAPCSQFDAVFASAARFWACLMSARPSPRPGRFRRRQRMRIFRRVELAHCGPHLGDEVRCLFEIPGSVELGSRPESAAPPAGMSSEESSMWNAAVLELRQFAGTKTPYSQLSISCPGRVLPHFLHVSRCRPFPTCN